MSLMADEKTTAGAGEGHVGGALEPPPVRVSMCLEHHRFRRAMAVSSSVAVEAHGEQRDRRPFLDLVGTGQQRGRGGSHECAWM